MKTIDADYTEHYLLPPSLEDWVSADHPARFIREMVSQMDLKALGIEDQSPVEGRPPYAKALLLRVWLYGYWKRIRSSRKLEEACCEDIGFVWLCGQHRPDHNTLWRFFRANRSSLRLLFKRTVKTAMDMDLVGLVLQAVDGTKIQALCTGYGPHRVKDAQKLEQALNEQIAVLEAGIEAASQQSPSESSHLPKELADKKVLRERVKAALEQATEETREYIQVGEPDARRMKNGTQRTFGYNAQAVVDGKSQIIVAEEAVVDETDQRQLASMMVKAKENTGTSVMTVADAGYSSGSELKKVADQNMEALVNLCENQTSEGQHAYHSSRFNYDKDRDVVTCPEGKELVLQRVRNKKGLLIRVYRSAAACKACPVRTHCTSDRHGRTIDIAPGREHLREMEDMLKDESKRALLARRCCIVEPVFAQIKAHGQFRRWTYGGLESVRAQWALLCSVWNLWVIYKHWRSKLPSPRPPRSLPLRIFSPYQTLRTLAQAA